MGNSEVGHLTIGSGRILDQDLQRVNRAIEDGSFFENPALQGGVRRAAETSTCSASSRTAASTRTSTTCKALLRFAPERTWIHAFTDGRDVSPHLGRARPRRAARRADRDRRRPLLRDGPRPALGAHPARLRRDRRGRGRARGRPGRRGRRRATSAGSRTSSSSRSCSRAAAARAATTRRSSSTSAPTARAS